ncbi:MAG: hypothetical protein KBS91_04085 [Firmicutes bacterium]|nr:hypothetical protein [Candidatus Caballimonas caccae]
MSNEAVKNSAMFQDSLQNLQTAIKGAKNTVFSEFLPSITSVMDGLTMIFSGNSEGGLAKINEGVGQFTE